MPLRPIAILLLACVSLAGCAAKTVPPIDVVAESSRAADALGQAFLPGAAILSGFDQPDPSGQWRIGDRLLLGLQIDKGGRRTVRFVLVELKSGVLPFEADVIVIGSRDQPPPDAQPAEAVDPAHPPKSVYFRLAEGDDPALVGRLPARMWGLKGTLEGKGGGREESFHVNSNAVLVAVQVFDDAGTKVKTSGMLAPEAYLRGGLFTACDLARRHADGGAVDDAAMMKAWTSTIPSLYGLGDVLRETPALARVIQPILPPPPLWALLNPWGVEFTFDLSTRDMREDSRLLPALAGGRRAYLLPLLLSINNDPAIQCVLSVADPSFPLHLCAGVVGIDGVQVKDPSCRFTMRLLAARRQAP